MPLNLTCGPLMLRLFDIAFQSRYSLPLLISVGFMVFDLHLQVSRQIIIDRALARNARDRNYIVHIRQDHNTQPLLE